MDSLEDEELSNLSEFFFNPVIQNRLLVSFSIGAALGAGLIHGIRGESAYCSTDSHVTRAEYERIELQMSLIEVEAILGRGIEVDQSKSTTTVIWTNCDESSITAIFEAAQMIKKSQTGL
ncbi:MAG: hypothetical protein AAGD96_35180 [Chloroflexota bacterium]